MERSDRGLSSDTFPAIAWINCVKLPNLNPQSPNACKIFSGLSDWLDGHPVVEYRLCILPHSYIAHKLTF